MRTGGRRKRDLLCLTIRNHTRRYVFQNPFEWTILIPCVVLVCLSVREDEYVLIAEHARAWQVLRQEGKRRVVRSSS